MGLDVRRLCASWIILLLSLAVVEGMNKKHHKTAPKGKKGKPGKTKGGVPIAVHPDVARREIEKCREDFEKVYFSFEEKVKDAAGGKQRRAKSEIITELLQRQSPTYFYDLESTECETAYKHSHLPEDHYSDKSKMKGTFCYGSKAVFTDKAVKALEENEVPVPENEPAMKSFLPRTQFASAVAFRGDKRSPESVFRTGFQPKPLTVEAQCLKCSYRNSLQCFPDGTLRHLDGEYFSYDSFLEAGFHRKYMHSCWFVSTTWYAPHAAYWAGMRNEMLSGTTGLRGGDSGAGAGGHSKPREGRGEGYVYMFIVRQGLHGYGSDNDWQNEIMATGGVPPTDIYAARKWVCTKSIEPAVVDIGGDRRMCEEGHFEGPILKNSVFEASSHIRDEMKRRHRASLCSDEVRTVPIDLSVDSPPVPHKFCEGACSAVEEDGERADMMKKDGFQLSNGEQSEDFEPEDDRISCATLGGTCAALPGDALEDAFELDDAITQYGYDADAEGVAMSNPCAGAGINDRPTMDKYSGCSKGSPVCCVTLCAMQTFDDDEHGYECVKDESDCDEETYSVLGDICEDEAHCCVPKSKISP